jgi:hypothetical protein
MAAIPAADPAGRNELDLTWAAPATGTYDKYVLAMSTDNFETSHTLANNLSSATVSYAATGLAPATTYSFQLYAVQNSTGYQAASSQVSATTLTGVSGLSCTVGLVTFTPSGATQAPNATTLVSNATASVHTTGVCPYLQLAYTPVEGSAVVTTVSLIQSIPGVWGATMNGTATNWSIGNHVVNVQNSAMNTLVQGNFIVCSAGKSTCP